MSDWQEWWWTNINIPSLLLMVFAPGMVFDRDHTISYGMNAMHVLVI